MEDKQQVAKEILQQLGGNKFTVMTGAKHFASTENSLRFHVGSNPKKVKYCKITLNVWDTYDMVFLGVKRKLNPEWAAIGVKMYDESTFEIYSTSGIYNDMLQEVFTEQTGLYTSL